MWALIAAEFMNPGLCDLYCNRINVITMDILRLKAQFQSADDKIPGTATGITERGASHIPYRRREQIMHYMSGRIVNSFPVAKRIG